MRLLPEGPTNPWEYGDDHLSIDFRKQLVLVDDQRTTLTRKEFELLALLVENAEQVVPRRALLQEVWGYGPAIRTRTLDVHIRRLRKRLAPYAERYIETIFGMGYRFQPFRKPRALQPAERPALAISA